jgi:hypothetical protein
MYRSKGWKRSHYTRLVGGAAAIVLFMRVCVGVKDAQMHALAKALTDLVGLLRRAGGRKVAVIVKLIFAGGAHLGAAAGELRARAHSKS